MVKLTCNLCISLGLTNNTRGIIRDILYRNNDGSYGGYNPDANLDEIILMIEISNYNGEQINDQMIINGQFNWLPITPRKLMCDCKSKCCSRYMFPVAVAKADSIYCLQGLTVGDLK